MRAASARTRASRFWYSSIELRDGAATWTKAKWPIQRGSSSSSRSTAREALQDALGVVEAIDADAELHVRREAQALAHALAGTRRTGGCTCSAAGGHSIEIG